MPKMMSPKTTITWFPENGFANPEAPTLLELNAGLNISCAIVTGYTLNFTDSDTSDAKTICDAANVQTRGFSNYEASLSFFRDAIGDAPTVFTTARNLFKGNERVTGWLVSRQGKVSTEAYAAGDVISLFKVTSDFGRSEAGDAGGEIQFTVPFLQAGEAVGNYEVTA